MLALIATVALPLFSPARLKLVQQLPLEQALKKDKILLLGIGEYKQLGFTINQKSQLQFFELNSGEIQAQYNLNTIGKGSQLKHVHSLGHGRYSLFWKNAASSLVIIGVKPQFDEDQQRTIVPHWEILSQQSAPANLSTISPASSGLPLNAILRQNPQSDSRLSLLPDGRLLLEHWRKTEGLFGDGENIHQDWILSATNTGENTEPPLLALSADGRNAYAAYGDRLFYWHADEDTPPGPLAVISQQSGLATITALSLLLGDDTLLAGHANGRISSWLVIKVPVFTTPSGESSITPELTALRTWQAHEAPVQQIVTASRSKSLLSLADDGTVAFSHNTSGRVLADLPLSGPKEAGDILAMAALDLRDQSIFALDYQGRASIWELDASHPEGGLRAFFGRIFYEGYQKPEYIWQSSTAEDTEPKLSLIPLVFGTLKATFYGMLFAAPLGVFSAMYASQMMETRLRNIVKPIFELMDAVPTVILGFLAAFWLAPLVETSLSSILLGLGLLPVVILVLMALVNKFSYSWGWLKFFRSREFLAVVPLVVVSIFLAGWLGSLLDKFWLKGPLTEWLFQRWDIYYDQRNAIVIAIALGFAVVPSIFSISEDALSNVPRRLTAASLALGASRWQTLWRVILPAASAGIFAALMLGLGRAVGETMIVLMAAGNTPIIDASIFTGMRTISANIAVEVPEAPRDSTLYRTLFLTATLLFMATFIINSLAELVRSRLRYKFSRH